MTTVAVNLKSAAACKIVFIGQIIIDDIFSLFCFFLFELQVYKKSITFPGRRWVRRGKSEGTHGRGCEGDSLKGPIRPSQLHSTGKISKKVEENLRDKYNKILKMFRDMNLRLSISAAHPSLVCHHGQGVLLKKTEI